MSLVLLDALMTNFPYRKLVNEILSQERFAHLRDDDALWRRKAEVEFNVTSWMWGLTVEHPMSKYLRFLSRKSVEIGSEKFISLTLCLKRASVKGDMELFHYFRNLIEAHGGKPFFTGCLYSCILHNQLEMVRFLLPYSFPDPYRCILKACKSGSREMFDFVYFQIVRGTPLMKDRIELDNFIGKPHSDYSPMIVETVSEVLNTAVVESLKHSFDFYLYVSRYIGSAFQFEGERIEDDIFDICCTGNLDSFHLIERVIGGKMNQIQSERAMEGAFISQNPVLVSLLMQRKKLEFQDMKQYRRIVASYNDNLNSFLAYFDSERQEMSDSREIEIAIQRGSYQILHYMFENCISAGLSEAVLDLICRKGYFCFLNLVVERERKIFVDFAQTAVASANFSIIERIFAVNDLTSSDFQTHVRDDILENCRYLCYFDIVRLVDSKAPKVEIRE
ncbi:hypothetical protein pv_163 [Pithovirus sibericum]|uniref:Ankyrin-repeat protein n=1 Tax=Pithovirus sibericum TaxID=1450746 RepID=W5SAE4_9VIRU|nr:hypothetical protein pv_163 [Pithovirus sibericum]AHH01730.1 hypothetical protein pv_163 [Pithovirus sibericum]